MVEMPGGCFGVSPADSMDHIAVGYETVKVFGLKD
jgi:hypothetical protein